MLWCEGIPSGGDYETPATVLRGRSLEIVDEHGRVRASITVYPADPAVKMPDGTTGYPETVLLRLLSSKGGPNKKLQPPKTDRAWCWAANQIRPTSSCSREARKRPSS